MRQPADRSHPEAGFVELEPLVLVGLDLVWVIVGLAAVLILFAFWLVLYVLNAILGGISIFGFHPFSFAFDLINIGMKKALGLLDSKAWKLGEAIYGVVLTVWRFVYVATVSIAGLAWQEVAHFAMTTGLISSEANRAKATEQGIQGDLSQQIGAANALINANAATADHNLQQAIAGIDANLYGLASQVQSEITAINQRLNGLNIPDIGGLQTQINNIGINLENQLNVDVSTINATINRDVTDLTQQINGGVATAEQFALGLVGGLGIGQLPTLLTQMQKQINNIQTETTECLDPLCPDVAPTANQLGNLGRLLQALEGLFAGLSLMALLVAGVEDPKGTARVVVDTTSWMTDLGLGMVDVVGSAAGVQL